MGLSNIKFHAYEAKLAEQVCYKEQKEMVNQLPISNEDKRILLMREKDIKR